MLQTYVVNLICQKVKYFQADSDYMNKINIKKNFKKNFFQRLALPKDPQSFCPYVVNAKKKCPQIFSKLVFYLLIPYKNIPKMSKMSKNCHGKWVQQASQIDPFVVKRRQSGFDSASTVLRAYL